MAWNEVRTMDEKKDFIYIALEECLSFSEWCRQFSVSRKTGYTWLERDNKEGLERPHLEGSPHSGRCQSPVFN